LAHALMMMPTHEPNGEKEEKEEKGVRSAIALVLMYAET